MAILELRDQREDLAREFLSSAQATGKPRGLIWRACDLDDGALFATDRTTGELLALIGATVSFEAVEGGDMEEVEAVGNLRCATAVFIHRGGRWTTDGRALFNHEPEQALERYADSLERIAPAGAD